MPSSHFESVNRNVYEKVTIKKVKHVRDNRYGHVVHTMATGTIQLATCVKYEENGDTANSIFDNMITNIAFGHNTAALPNLTGLMLGYDRGYVFRDCIAKMMDCGSRIHSTLKICPWAPITYDQQVGSNDKRTVMQLGGIPTLKLKHVTLKSQAGIGIGTKLTVGAYRYSQQHF